MMSKSILAIHASDEIPMRADGARGAARRPAAEDAGTRQSEWASPWALTNVLLLSGVAVVLLGVWVLADLGGWAYYQVPLRVRGYAAAHALLRPSGRIGHPLGIAGLLMMGVPFLYSWRKNRARVAGAGSLRAWLDVHIFCGIVGPAMVMFHTSFKFNGIVSVAFWAMALVVGSGFVGRYLYVRIPKTIRGAELTYDEIVEHAADLRRQLLSVELPEPLLAKVAAFETAVAVRPEHLSMWRIPFGRLVVLRRLHALRHELREAGVHERLLRQVVHLTDVRMLLLHRLTYLHRTRQLFALWHLFHKPLVWLMFAIAALHVAAALYLGYLPI